MWFWLSLAALLCWSGSDLFSKIGCRDSGDKTSHLKMLVAVGTVMGLHAVYSLTFGKVLLTAEIFIKYLPVSALYIGSMAIGYLGLRYIELSVSSPICNSSGAVVAFISFAVYGRGSINNWQLAAVLLVIIGAVGLGFAEMSEDEEARALRQKDGKYFYKKTAWALVLPSVYCLLDAAGTFADNLVLAKIPEDGANTAYELTFFAVGFLSFLYLKFIKKEKFLPQAEAPKYLGAVCETAGQFAYIYAISDTKHLMLTAPIIASYCTVSVLWGRIFLKEKLSAKHYLAIFTAIVGIVVLGLFEEL